MWQLGAWFDGNLAVLLDSMILKIFSNLNLILGFYNFKEAQVPFIANAI